MYDTPLTNVYDRLGTKRSLSRVITNAKIRYKRITMITKMFMNLGKQQLTSREKPVLEVEEQTIDDRFGDVPK
jgi:hypothetical protein